MDWPFVIKVMNDKRQAGQLDFNPSTDKLTTKKYGVGINAEQYSFTGKLGYVFPQHKYKKLGFIVVLAICIKTIYIMGPEQIRRQNKIHCMPI